MKLPSASEMRAFDEATIKSGTTSQSLMESAGKSMFTATARLFPGISKEDKKILILSGPGNNGGDGLVVARHFVENGYSTNIVIASSLKYSDDFLHELKLLFASLNRIDSETTRVFLFGDGTQPNNTSLVKPIAVDEVISLIAESNLIFDALLGTGSIGEPRGSVQQIICLINSTQTQADIVALDIPSGVNPDTGEVSKSTISAALTLTVQLIKRGLLQHPAREHAGDIEVLDIGINTEGETEYSLLTPSSLPKLKVRNLASHKGNFGRVLVIGGSSEMPGAPYLAGESALRSGAGLVTVASGSGIFPKAAPELMRLDLGEIKHHSIKGLNRIEEALSVQPVVVVGPGLGTNEETSVFLHVLLNKCIELNLKVVVDADALNLLASTKKFPDSTNFVYTPHPGEASRLLDISTSEVQRDRYTSAKKLTKLFANATIVLKGSATVVQSGIIGWVNSTGNPYLATAGSGDVLSGIIAALMAQGLAPSEAARLGVFVHGLSGDRAVAELRGPIIASNLFSTLPRTIREFVDQSS